MTQRNDDDRLERVNLMLGREESDWLDQLAAEILAATGSKVSRSEIVRAAIDTLRELHRVAPTCPAWLMPLGRCKSGMALAQAGVLAVRWAVRE